MGKRDREMYLLSLLDVPVDNITLSSEEVEFGLKHNAE